MPGPASPVHLLQVCAPPDSACLPLVLRLPSPPPLLSSAPQTFQLGRHARRVHLAKVAGAEARDSTRHTASRCLQKPEPGLLQRCFRLQTQLPLPEHLPDPDPRAKHLACP